MRKGELLGFWKSDVDLAERSITVRRSYDSETTKGGRADVIQIAEPLVPYLDAAVATSMSKYVLPAERRLDALRRARPAADPTPRAWPCSHRARVGLRVPSEGLRPSRGAQGAVRAMLPEVQHASVAKRAAATATVHDLRGTTATLLARAGAPLVVAQRILRHSDPRLTANVYLRVDLGDLLDGINKIAIPVHGVAGMGTRSPVVSLQGFVATLSPNDEAPRNEGFGLSGSPQ